MIKRADVYINEKVMTSWKNEIDKDFKNVKDLKSVLKNAINKSKDGTNKRSLQYYYLLSTGQTDHAIGADASHELEHATSDKNIQTYEKEKAENLDNYNKDKYEKDVESQPHALEQKDLNERTN